MEIFYKKETIDFNQRTINIKFGVIKDVNIVHRGVR